MAEAGDIQQVMEQLRDLIPVIPERVEAVATKGSELRRATETVVHEYKEVQGQAEQLFREIEAEIDGLRADAQRHAAEITAEIAQVEQAVEKLRTLDEARGELLQGVEKAGETMAALQGVLQAGIEEAKHVGEEFKDGLHHVHEMTRQGLQLMSQGLDVTHGAANKLQEEMKAGADSLEHLFDSYSQQLKDHEHKMLDKVEEYLGHAKDLHQQFDSHVDDILKNVVQKGADEVMDQMKEAIENQLKALVDEATQEIVDAIDNLVHT
jgi:ElaB/YqjD/DUF883 family membrane-anchored ribosome-binding protein